MAKSHSQSGSSEKEKEKEVPVVAAKEEEDEADKTPSIEFNDKTYQSYINTTDGNGNNFADQIPYQVSAPHDRMTRFISRVNLEKGPFERRITVMCRFKAKMPNPKTKKTETKEYLTYREEWIAYDWLGQKMRNEENLEGEHQEIDTAPIVEFDNETGRMKITGQKFAGAHTVYTIPFSKEKVDKAIAKSDSDKSEILYKVKAPPCSDYFNYDEFTNYSWEQLDKILLKPGGAKAARAELQARQERDAERKQLQLQEKATLSTTAGS